jgi:hypothetical protein
MEPVSVMKTGEAMTVQNGKDFVMQHVMDAMDQTLTIVKTV